MIRDKQIIKRLVECVPAELHGIIQKRACPTKHKRRLKLSDKALRRRCVHFPAFW
jgi:hypothetical protein